MKVLVTGHKGYIGTVLVPCLLDKGYDVMGMDSDLYRGCDFGDPSQICPIPEMRQDIRHAKLRDFEGYDAVIHLAGLAYDPAHEIDPKLFHDINLTATVQLAKLAKKAGVPRFILASSCSVYGKSGDSWVDEDSPTYAVDPYTRAKIEAEKGILKFTSETFSPTILRNATVYGISPRMRFDSLINYLTAYAYTQGMVYLNQVETEWRTLVHVEDAVHAILTTLEASREVVHGEIFNVGQTQDSYTVGEIAEQVKAVIPNSRIAVPMNGDGDQRSYRVNCDKIRYALPDFQPQWDLARGLDALVECYEQLPLQSDDFKDRRYQRIAHLQDLMSESMLSSYLYWTAKSLRAVGV